MRSLVRRWPLALLAGVLIGALLAVAIPRSRAEAPAEPALLRVAPMRPLPAHQSPFDVKAGTMHITARTPDPAGGPDWAIRVFTGTARLETGLDGKLSKATVRRLRRELHAQKCAQLGRIVGGRFGWIDAVRTFRPVPFGYGGAPILCGSDPAIDLTLLTTDPQRTTAAVRQAVAWGAGGAPGTSVALRRPGARTRVPTGAQGAWLAFVPTTVQLRQLHADVQRPGGGAVTLPQLHPFPPPAWAKKHEITTPEPEVAAMLQARAPDPDGGLPYGIAAAPAKGGGWCIGQVGRIVGTRVGNVNAQLGTLAEGSGAVARCPGLGGGDREQRPLDLGYSYGGSDMEEWTGVLGDRVARRTLKGRTMFYGRALPSIRTLTFSTPRDERTIAPTGPAHVFLVVYDGTFPTGRTVITARFADGHTEVVDRIGAMSGP